MDAGQMRQHVDEVLAALERRKSAGKRVLVAAAAAGMLSAFDGCVLYAAPEYAAPMYGVEVEDASSFDAVTDEDAGTQD